ncbi:DUF4174 domain-containing protein [Rhodobacteraceae bacterium CCMM004]|nr:DUF4174 domain-containing protein [Rhodobacteraceae bacterium CCMM004]
MSSISQVLRVLLLAVPAVAMPLAAQETAQTAAATGPDPAASEPATETPVLLAPVDRWREDPKVVMDAVEVDLAAFQWIARPVVVFADTPADPAFQQQIDLLAGRADDLAVRDVVVITDTDPAALSDLRRKLRPRGFMLAILGKDGGVKLRKPFPWDVREITRTIDKMPLRKQEIRDRQNANQ